MKEFIEGSAAVAKAVALCRPGVIAAYPITPQTHIVEELAQIVADGELDAEFINVESEHSAASLVLGASATGVRAFSATTSQGLLLMLEVLYNMAGMRLPVIITIANRAVSAPINIWNDHQDSVTMRDAGILQFYGETIQEVVDLHLQAYRIGEDRNVMLPALVCMDGYILTHGLEVVDMPAQEQVDRFLPQFAPIHKLDPEDPVTMGVLSDASYYLETRYAIHETMKDVLKMIPRVVDEFEEIFGRRSGGLFEAYRMDDAERVIVGKGSVMGTVKSAVDEMRKEGEKVGALKVITYRPFPAEALAKVLSRVPRVAVLEKAISLGAAGPLYTDLCVAFFGKPRAPRMSGFIAGLGGRDIRIETVRRIFAALDGECVSDQFVDVRHELITA